MCSMLIQLMIFKRSFADKDSVSSRGDRDYNKQICKSFYSKVPITHTHRNGKT